MDGVFSWGAEGVVSKKGHVVFTQGRVFGWIVNLATNRHAAATAEGR